MLYLNVIMLEKQENSTKKPLVSIGLYVWNGAECIRAALDSLLAQTFKDFELIISDNASTDDTQKICREYERNDSRIRYIRQKENIGGYTNADFVRHETRGQYFMWACHDDIWDKHFIKKCLEKFKEDQNAIGVFSRFLSDEPAGTIEIDPSKSFPFSKDLYQRLKSYLKFRVTDGKVFTIYSLWRSDVLTDFVDKAGYSDINWVFKQLFFGYLLLVDEILFQRREATKYHEIVFKKNLTKFKIFLHIFTDRLISARGDFSRVHLKYIWRSRALTKTEKIKLSLWEGFAYLRGIWTGHY